ncbi:kinase-like protein [Suillus decipiens]|nr:kinase-like protein [Suillus decipiens]
MNNRFSRREKRNVHPHLTHQTNRGIRRPPYIPVGAVKKLEVIPSRTERLGDVWKCCLSRSMRKVVAVKDIRIPQGNDKKLVRLASKNISLLASLSISLAHENILVYYGIIEGFGLLPALVSPWMEKGSLDDYLKQGRILSEVDKLKMLGQIAAGLNYLHSKGVVHGDLTSSNVLIKNNGKLCLAYFGLSMTLMRAQISPFDVCHPGHVRWMAPEMLAMPEREGVVRRPMHDQARAADVYSYGCIMLQLFCGHMPYCWLTRPLHVIVARVAGIEPFRQFTGVKEIHKAYSFKCLSVNPEDRPMTFEIVKFLKAV